ncbi:hypothetical protein A3Q56_05644 [Intoshia linei]|uniref:Pinin/SDK/MemA protein domain-containing protein n=1 Tax=Intoshia linei TaxID=1819745 RepID=A0A177AYP3_9BILA|nr:hypothetical protein A3Q56_05644 [Intoshia linei]
MAEIDTLSRKYEKELKKSSTNIEKIGTNFKELTGTKYINYKRRNFSNRSYEDKSRNYGPKTMRLDGAFQQNKSWDNQRKMRSISRSKKQSPNPQTERNVNDRYEDEEKPRPRKIPDKYEPESQLIPRDKMENLSRSRQAHIEKTVSKIDKKTLDGQKRRFGSMFKNLTIFKTKHDKTDSIVKKQKTIIDRVTKIAEEEKCVMNAKRFELMDNIKNEKKRAYDAKRKLFLLNNFKESRNLLEPLKKFIRTNSTPCIFYKPVEMCEKDVIKSNNTCQYVDDLISKKRKEFYNLIDDNGKTKDSDNVQQRNANLKSNDSTDSVCSTSESSHDLNGKDEYNLDCKSDKSSPKLNDKPLDKCDDVVV